MDNDEDYVTVTGEYDRSERAEEKMEYDFNQKPGGFDFVLKMTNHPHAHEVCRRIRPRNNGFQLEIEFCDGTRDVVSRQMVKNISAKRI